MPKHVLWLLATAIAVAGCASGTPPAPVFKTVAIDDAGAVKTTTLPAARHTIGAPLSTVWNTLGAAYQAVGIDLTLADAPNHRVGNMRFNRFGHMNGEPVSRFVSCGNGMTGPIADRRRVVFSVVTTVTAVDATHTELVTDVEAYASDVSGESNDRVSCASTGALEQRLYRALEQRLGTK